MIALDEQGTTGLGVARYVRDPDRPEAAEVAVTVEPTTGSDVASARSL